MFRLSVPAILAQLINVLYNIVDRIYIAYARGWRVGAYRSGRVPPLIINRVGFRHAGCDEERPMLPLRWAKKTTREPSTLWAAALPCSL
jgi:Na+-driven multidrug efflux pump